MTVNSTSHVLKDTIQRKIFCLYKLSMRLCKKEKGVVMFKKCTSGLSLILVAVLFIFITPTNIYAIDGQISPFEERLLWPVALVESNQTRVIFRHSR